MMQKKADKEKEAGRKLLFSNTPTSSSNSFSVNVNKDRSSVLVQLISDLPGDLSVENHRTTLSAEAVKRLIDALSKAINYYPKKTSSTKSKTISKTKT